VERTPSAPVIEGTRRRGSGTRHRAHRRSTQWRTLPAAPVSRGMPKALKPPEPPRPDRHGTGSAGRPRHPGNRRGLPRSAPTGPGFRGRSGNRTGSDIAPAQSVPDGHCPTSQRGAGRRARRGAGRGSHHRPRRRGVTVLPPSRHWSTPRNIASRGLGHGRSSRRVGAVSVGYPAWRARDQFVDTRPRSVRPSRDSDRQQSVQPRRGRSGVLRWRGSDHQLSVANLVRGNRAGPRRIAPEDLGDHHHGVRYVQLRRLLLRLRPRINPRWIPRARWLTPEEGVWQRTQAMNDEPAGGPAGKMALITGMAAGGRGEAREPSICKTTRPNSKGA
jgi:hypothetical protein